MTLCFVYIILPPDGRGIPLPPSPRGPGNTPIRVSSLLSVSTSELRVHERAPQTPHEATSCSVCDVTGYHTTCQCFVASCPASTPFAGPRRLSSSLSLSPGHPRHVFFLLLPHALSLFPRPRTPSTQRYVIRFTFSPLSSRYAFPRVSLRVRVQGVSAILRLLTGMGEIHVELLEMRLY